MGVLDRKNRKNRGAEAGDQPGAPTDPDVASDQDTAAPDEVVVETKPKTARVYRARHPSLRSGNGVISHGNKDVPIDYDKDGVFETEDKSLWEILLRYEAHTDVTDYRHFNKDLPPKPAPVHAKAWILKIPHAKDDDKVTGSTSVEVRTPNGTTATIPLVIEDNLVRIENDKDGVGAQALKELLLSQFTIHAQE